MRGSAKPYRTVQVRYGPPQRKEQMKRLTIIACVQPDGGIGYQGDLIWKIPLDMAIFKHFTMGHTVVMGAGTFKSLGMKPLKGRQNLVLSHFETSDPDVKVLHSMADLEALINLIDDEVFIIGGATLYKHFMDKADRLILTEIDEDNRPADTFFPQIAYFPYCKKLASWLIPGECCETYEYSR